MDSQQIVDIVHAEIPDAQVTPEGADCNFKITVVAEYFKGMMPVKRQQAILGLFSEQIRTSELHALSVVAKTPSEFEASQAPNLTSIQP